jgi:hypothetical protein
MDTSERTIIHMGPNNRASVLSNIGNILEPSIANLSPATKSNTLLFERSGTKKKGLAKWKKKKKRLEPERAVYLRDFQLFCLLSGRSKPLTHLFKRPRQEAQT